MHANGINAIEEQLQKESALLSRKVDALRAELNSMETDLGRVGSALAALKGDASSPFSGKSVKKRKATNPSASKAHVVALLSDELAKNQNLSDEALKQRIEQRVVETGHTRVGFALRFKEALATTRCNTQAIA